jgi:hypothetical protein
MQPIRPHEPAEATFDTPVEMPVTVYTFPLLPLFAPALPVPPGELTPTVPVLPAAAGPTIGKSGGGGIWFPLIPIIPPIHHRHPTSPGGPIVPVPPPIIPPVAVVPEPRYMWILALAFLALILIHRLRRPAA